MIDKRLNKVREFVENWCNEHNIYTSSMSDMAGIEGIKVFERDRRTYNKLLEDLTPVLDADNLFLDTRRVRGGILLAFTLRALAESEINRFITSIGETLEPMTFKDRIADAFNKKPVIQQTANKQPQISEKRIDFFASAKKINEEQYKTATQGASRSNQTGLQRETHGQFITLGGVKPKKKKKPSSPSSSMEYRYKFGKKLDEALGGMATPDDMQPKDLFSRFASALSELGAKLQVGPIQDLLKSKGISYKKSDDGQDVILYVMNAQTNAQQPIARISAETLSTQKEFEEQLKNLLDIAQGDEPGASKRMEADLKAKSNAAREAASAFSPQPPQQPGQSAPDAATQAAMPKTAAVPAM